MNASWFFHPRYEAHRVFATREVKAWLTLWNKVNRRAVPGASWPYARQALRAPYHVARAVARKLGVRHGPARRWGVRPYVRNPEGGLCSLPGRELDVLRSGCPVAVCCGTDLPS